MPFKKEANILKASAIFEQRKDVMIDEGEKNKFHQLLLVLNDDQQDLMIDLLSRFKWVKGERKIFDEIKHTFQQILLKPSLGINFVIYPLKKKGESGKGSDRLWADLKLYKGYEKLPEFNLNFYNHIDKFLRIPKDSKIILIDDYIGSGQTVIESISSFLDELEELGLSDIDRDRIVVVCLYGQEEGINKLNGLGYNIIAGNILKKGISDYYEGCRKERVIAIMESIETIMNGKGKLGSGFNFGRNRSEGLIAFTRCPNNTFPVFWFKESYKEGSKRPFTFIR